MKVVLDSNILISSLGKSSPFRPIWDAFIDSRYQIVVSEDILKEYEEMMIAKSAPGTSNIVLEIFLESPDVLLQKIFYNWNAITTDPDDNKFFDVAVAADVDVLVTNDRHFDIAKTIKFPKVKVITADDFLQIVTSTI